MYEFDMQVREWVDVVIFVTSSHPGGECVEPRSGKCEVWRPTVAGAVELAAFLGCFGSTSTITQDVPF